MDKKEINRMAYKEVAFRLRIELDNFNEWTLDENLTEKDKCKLFKKLSDIANTFAIKGCQ